jgi:hypothetical protein
MQTIPFFWTRVKIATLLETVSSWVMPTTMCERTDCQYDGEDCWRCERERQRATERKAK